MAQFEGVRHLLNSSLPGLRFVETLVVYCLLVNDNAMSLIMKDLKCSFANVQNQHLPSYMTVMSS